MMQSVSPLLRGFSVIQKITFAVLYASCALFVAGCANSSHTGVSGNTSSATSSTTVASVTPAAGTSSVMLNSAIQITFSSAVAAGTVNAANIQIAGAQPVVGAVTYNTGNYTATFTPSAAFAANTKYTVEVNGVTDAAGKALAAFSSTFTTGQSTAAAGDNTVEYQATLFPTGQGVTGSGQIYIVTCGCVTVQMTGAADTTTYGVSFCPAYPSGQTAPSCMSVGSIETDASGSADQTIHFPHPGSWAGDFELQAGSATQYSTSFVPPTAAGGSSEVYMATLQPVSTVNSGALEPSGSTQTQSPIGAGTVTWFGGALQFSMAGGLASTKYAASQNGLALGSSSSYQLSNSQAASSFTSDGSGNLSFSAVQDGNSGDLFELEPQVSQAGYIGGFSVPN